MFDEILTVEEMYAADQYAVAHGVPSFSLMENAGRSVAEEITTRWSVRSAVVLCGPGNNGGDGYVAARHLKESGWPVRVAHLGPIDRLKGDSAQMAQRWDGFTAPIESNALEGAELVIDALFGAGLSRPLEQISYGMVEALNRGNAPVIAIDVPSGLHGDLAHPLGNLCVDADLTVTFFRKKPAHVLMPGARACGEVSVTDIGIPNDAIRALKVALFENNKRLWQYPWPQANAH